MLSSKNKSKLVSLMDGLMELGITGIDVESFKVKSDVSSKPVNEDILNGCLNRNRI